LVDNSVRGRPLVSEWMNTHICPEQVTEGKRLNNHLVAGSIAVTHGCRDIDPITSRPIIYSNECVHYTIIGRNRVQTSINGRGAIGCNVEVMALLFQQVGGRWRVIDEVPASGVSEDCTPKDLSLWGRRVPWR
jgi:hypothetical protein